MTKCLITGASGFVGQALVDRLGRDFDVRGVAFHYGGPQFIRSDIRDPDAFRTLLLDTRPGVVVHAAAYPEPDFAEEHPEEAWRLNVGTVRTLRESLPAVARLVFISSDYVFDGDHPPYDEKSERRPVSAYGRMKCEAEDILADRPNTITLRIGVQVGRALSPKRPGFINEMIGAVRSGREQVVDNVLVRFPTWTKDTAEAVHFLISAGAAGTFHLSGPRGATRYAWTLETASLLKLDASHIRPTDRIVPRKAQRPVNSQLATTKIRTLGYTQFTEFPDVVKDLIESEKGL